MKNIFKFFSILGLATLLFTSCTKVEELAFNENGKMPVLSSNTSTLNSSAADSNKVVLMLSSTNPAYANDSATTRYELQIAPKTTNFAKPLSITQNGKRMFNLTAKQINAMMLGYGFAYNSINQLEARILTSYANFNQQYVSNIITISAKVYVTPPKVQLPVNGTLFLVGSATQGGWNNPVPTPTQEFTKIDSVTWGGVFQLNGSSEYLVLPVNGSWTDKYSIADKSLSSAKDGGSFGFGLNDNFAGPIAAGMYTIILNFQTGVYTVMPFTSTLPTDLFMVGDATVGGWGNPVPVPSQQLTRVGSAGWEITVPFTGSGEYLLLPVNGSWSNKYSVANKSLSGLAAGGDFGYNLNDNFPSPSAAGNYKLSVNFATGKFTTTKM
jgi:starch-binding outer membrane protein SusE/F